MGAPVSTKQEENLRLKQVTLLVKSRSEDQNGDVYKVVLKTLGQDHFKDKPAQWQIEVGDEMQSKPQFPRLNYLHRRPASAALGKPISLGTQLISHDQTAGLQPANTVEASSIIVNGKKERIARSSRRAGISTRNLCKA